jgi:DNA-binding PadR family transcriptional regulator
MLDVLRLCGGEATTRTIREDANVPDGSIHYHLRQLCDSGVIEQAGTRRVESGETANVYRLTGLGQEVITAWLDDRGRLDLDDFDSRLRDHARRLDSHAEQLDNISESVNRLSALESEVAELSERREKDEDTLQKLREFLEKQDSYDQ